MRYWRVLENFIEYKSPDPLGAILLPVDILEPGYQLDVSTLKFRFVHNKSDQRAIGDFAFWNPGFFFVSERGFAALRPMFLRHGRAFPIACGKLNYVIVTVDTVLDALDLARSKYERYGFEDDVSEDISRLLRIRLKEDFATEADIFRLQGILPVTLNVIVSDAFKRTCAKNNLTGLIFKRAS